MKKIDSTFTLNTGGEIPIFGLGLYKAPNDQKTINAIHWAWEVGYRLFDTAQIYGNEKAVGTALQELKAERKDYFVTTKLWRDVHGDDVSLSLRESLDKLQLDYVDLFLMHWPIKEHRLDNWDRMIELYNSGLTKAIGVSNFTKHHLQELLDHSDVIPAVNQMEHSIYLNNEDLVEYCKEHNILYEAYSPLTKARKLDDPKLVKMAEKYDRTPAQIMLRWVVDHDIIVIPKSTNNIRIRENADIFDFTIDPSDIEEMRNWDEHLVTGWNPYNYD